MLTEEPRTATETPVAPKTAPHPLPEPLVPGVQLPPDGLRYRLKNKLLGPPLHTEQLEHERLGKPTALAVFASDNLSSSAYATEEMLRVLDAGHRPRRLRAGRADHHRAARRAALPDPLLPPDDQGLPERRRRVHGDARQLRIAARAGRRRRAAHRLRADGVGIGRGRYRRARVGVQCLHALDPADRDQLRRDHRVGKPARREGVGQGLRGPHLLLHPEHGRAHRCRRVQVDPRRARRRPTTTASTASLPFGTKGDGLLVGASLAVVLHAFASGGAAVTGVEAISNGVPAFKKPAWKNARTTLVIMGSLARRDVPRLVDRWTAHMHVSPYTSGTPTVISQIGKLAYGGSLVGQHPLLLPAGRHDADPRARRQHELRRLPPPRVVPRRRQLHAPPAHQARAPPGVLERHHLPRGRRHRGAHRDRRQGRPAHPALRDRRVHVVHALAGGHGQAPHHAEGTRAGGGACSSTAPASS